jgi:hypothetical protein
MIDVPFEVSPSMDAGQIESFLKQYLGAKVGGVSSGGGRVVLHANDLLTQTELQMVQSILTTQSYGLTVVTNKPQITANGQDTATILCNNPVIAADTTLAYTVTFTGVIDGVSYTDGDYASGTAALEAGAVNLTLAVDHAGTYRVELRRTAAGAKEFGTTIITAVGE